MVVFGTVTATQDELNMGRVEVMLDDHGAEIKVWVRVMQPMASAESGAFFLPEIDDQVVILQGPGGVLGWVVIGCLYTGTRLPKLPEADGKNNIKQIFTRAGSEITLDDTDGAELIRIQTIEGKVGLLLENAGTKLTITGETEVNINSTTKVVVEAENVEVTGSAEVKISGSSAVAIDGGDVEISGSGSVKISGPTVELG